ncbi:hypothetical protein RO3G_07087 [Rhizopus delemar RA 99-880]|uniref:Major facilitator superfamily (MFS) profile domain-containing protein n=1 Tax=Rhizopus delemar (strain RA 99-880 / ATCC MYA-4621 / FGSC 9543 / NRRL 43880) TaxID=246409 RepID=I1C1Q2_RHIO9|nr:hypothetical protein RO3G_07087 [Rhizopus delemar RA 99-880]|eukprot:EIE82382.1 hypothetical protein RO3G_07087 [Rhizopus delemar RA 99-880]
MIGPNLETMDRAEDKGSRNKWWNKSSGQQDPLEFSAFKKNVILLIVAVAGAISPLASTIYYPAIVTMQTYFNTNDTTMNASLSVFTFLTAFFPLIWATFGDRFGRRNIYLISFLISVIGSICCAVSINVQMFIAFRAVSAIGSSSVMSMGAGTIADIFEPRERGRAFAYYTCGPLLGPAIGPIVGGYLNKGLGWRSIFWCLAILSFSLWTAIFFFLPETWRPPVMSSEPTSKEKQPDPEQPIKKSRVMNPLKALGLLFYPNIALVIAYVAILVYSNQYHLDTGIVGICYLPFAVGAMLGGIFGGRFSDRVYNASVAKAKEKNEAIYSEMRLNVLVLGCSNLIQALALIAYGWCIHKDVHLAYGLVCQFICKQLFSSYFFYSHVCL